MARTAMPSRVAEEYGAAGAAAGAPEIRGFDAGLERRGTTVQAFVEEDRMCFELGSCVWWPKLALDDFDIYAGDKCGQGGLQSAS